MNLREEFDSLREQINELKELVLNNPNSQPQIEKPKNIEAATEITGFSKPTIYSHCQKNTIPHHKKNGRLFFFESELTEWIREGKQKTLKEIEGDITCKN